MDETLSDRRPLLVVVAGRPGAGKTTLAHALARAIRCPAICRDEIKEGIVNSSAVAAPHGDAIQRHANDAFFDTVELLLRRGVTLVAEAAFQHAVWAPRLEPLFAVATAKVVLCTVDAEAARARHVERGLGDPERERFHGDHAVRAAREGRQLPMAGYDPPRFDVPTLVVDTTNGYHPHFDAIAAFARGERAVDRGR